MDGHPVVLIELGTEHGVPELDRPRSPRARRAALRWPALCLIALLLLVSVTAAVPPGRDLRQVGGLEVPPGAAFVLAGHLLLVANPSLAPTTLSAYDLPDARLRWQVPVAAAASFGAASFGAELAGDLLLVAEVDSFGRRIATTARSARTGQSQWRRPGPLLVATDAATGVAISEVRSASGAGRRIEGTIEVIDLANGQTRWTLPVPSTAVAELVPGQPGGHSEQELAGRLVVVHDNGAVYLHDLRTGAVLSGGRLPPADYAPDNPVVADGRLILRHPTGSSGGSLVSGYDLADLTLRWTLPEQPAGGNLRGCGDLVCLENRRRILAIDPATGGQRWTGMPHQGWGRLDHNASTERRILLRPTADHSIIAVDEGADLRVVGALPAGVLDCRAGAVALVCRTGPARLGIWRMRLPDS
jgi:hypothetical protein